MTTPSLTVEDFDAAKAVLEQISNLPRERQERILRWIAEGLGFAPAQTTQTPSAAPGHAPQPLHAPQPTPVATGGRDIKSFIAEKAPNSDNQFAAAVAYYYRFEALPAQRKDTIGTETLQEAARLAGRRRLTEPRKTLHNAKQMGYLDAASRGQYSINSVGENLVAMALPAGASGNQPAAPRKRKPKPKKPQRKSGR